MITATLFLLMVTVVFFLGLGAIADWALGKRKKH